MGYYVKGKAIETGIPLRGHIPDDPVVLATLAELELRASAEPFAFIWLGLLQPSKLEMAQVGEVFGLDHLLMEDSLNPHQRAKMDIRPDHLMVVFKVISYIEETSAVETGQITAFVGPHSVVTVRLGPVGDLGDIRAGLEARPDLMRHGPQAVVYALFDGIVDGYLEVTDELTQDIEQLEEQVFSPTPTDPGIAYRLKRENLELRRAAAPLVGIADKLADFAQGSAAEEFRPLFDDVNDHLLRVRDNSDTNDSLLISLLMAATARQDLQQNRDMRKISAWVAIAAVPTMIAGIYGMNFDFMPELHQPWGYPMILGLMVTVCGLMYRAFKRSGWL